MIDSLIEPTGSLPFLSSDSLLTVMKKREPALHEGTSSQGDNEEVEDIRFNRSSLPFSASLNEVKGNVTAVLKL